MGMAKFDPAMPVYPLTDRHQIRRGNYVGDTYYPAKFYPEQITGFVSAHALLRAPKMLILGYFWVLTITYSTHGF